MGPASCLSYTSGMAELQLSVMNNEEEEVTPEGVTLEIPEEDASSIK